MQKYPWYRVPGQPKAVLYPGGPKRLMVTSLRINDVLWSGDKCYTVLRRPRPPVDHLHLRASDGARLVVKSVAADQRVTVVARTPHTRNR